MNTRLESTASSCGVMTSGMRLTAPRVPWMVSSSVRPVRTRVVIVVSSSESVAHDWMSLDSGTFARSQKSVVRRSQTSRSMGTAIGVQLIAWIGLMRSVLSVVVVVMSGVGAPGRRGPFSAEEGWSGRSERAAHAVLHLRAGEGLLPEADVVERLDALAPSVDLRPVEVTRGHRVLEEEGQRQALVHVLGGRGVGVDDLLVADLVGVLVVLEVVVRHVGRRVVDAPELALLADLDLRHDRVDRGGRVVDVGDGAGGRDGLEVLVVQAVLLDRGGERTPVVLRGDVHARLREELADPLGLRHPLLLG